MEATSITIGKTYFSGTRVPSVLLTEYPAPEALSSAKTRPLPCLCKIKI